MRRTYPWLGVLALLAAASAYPQTQTIQVKSMETRLFLQDEGVLSQPVSGLPDSPVLWNVIIGSEKGSRPSSSSMVIVKLTGPAGSYNTKVSVLLSVTAKGRTVRHRAYQKRLGVFNDQGVQYVAFWLAETGCEELELVSRTSQPGPSVVTNVPFACGE